MKIKPCIELKAFEKDVMRINGTKEMEESEKIAVLLLASLQEGVNIKNLHKFTKYPIGLIKKTIGWLRSSGTYKNGKFNVEWFEDHGGIALICDTLAVQGVIKKVLK